MTAEAERTRRLFFALWLDRHARQELLRSSRRAVRQCGGRPVAPRNYHITLAFLGSVAADRFQAICAAARAVSVPNFRLTLSRFGYWPRPRVFWMGTSSCPPLLRSLHHGLWSQLESLDFTREPRAFAPHVTLCRKVRAAPALPAATQVSWMVNEFVLVESVTAAKGPVYEIVARFPGD